MIRAIWLPSERAKWESFRSGRGEQGFASRTETTSDREFLTSEEKKWLKDNYADELHFLRTMKEPW